MTTNATIFPSATTIEHALTHVASDLTEHYAQTLTAEQVAQAVSTARSEIEPGQVHPEYLVALVEHRARVILAELAAR